MLIFLWVILTIVSYAFMASVIHTVIKYYDIAGSISSDDRYLITIFWPVVVLPFLAAKGGILLTKSILTFKETSRAAKLKEKREVKTKETCHAYLEGVIKEGACQYDTLMLCNEVIHNTTQESQTPYRRNNSSVFKRAVLAVSTPVAVLTYKDRKRCNGKF